MLHGYGKPSWKWNHPQNQVSVALPTNSFEGRHWSTIYDNRGSTNLGLTNQKTLEALIIWILKKLKKHLLSFMAFWPLPLIESATGFKIVIHHEIGTHVLEKKMTIVVLGPCYISKKNPIMYKKMWTNNSNIWKHSQVLCNNIKS